MTHPIPDKTSPVTIGFVAKEKFNLAPVALEHIFRHTHYPFNLLIIDCGYPNRIRAEIDRLVEGQNNVRIIKTETYLQPNASKNIVLREAADECICILENDLLVPDFWLGHMMEALEEYPDALVIPVLYEEEKDNHQFVHFDFSLGHISRNDETSQIVIKPDYSLRESLKWTDRRVVETLENHVLLFNRNLIDDIGLFDENICTREQYDLSLKMFSVNRKIVLESRVKVCFHQAPPVFSDEIDFFRFCWDRKKAEWTHYYLIEKWNLKSLPSSLGFARGQQYRHNYLLWTIFRIYREFENKLLRIVSKKYRQVETVRNPGNELY